MDVSKLSAAAMMLAKGKEQKSVEGKFHVMVTVKVATGKVSKELV